MFAFFDVFALVRKFFVFFNEVLDCFEIFDKLFTFSSVLFKLIKLFEVDSIESSNKFLYFKLLPNCFDLFSEQFFSFPLLGFLSTLNLLIDLFNFLVSFFLLKLILILFTPLLMLLFIVILQYCDAFILESFKAILPLLKLRWLFNLFALLLTEENCSTVFVFFKVFGELLFSIVFKLL